MKRFIFILTFIFIGLTAPAQNLIEPIYESPILSEQAANQYYLDQNNYQNWGIAKTGLSKYLSDYTGKGVKVCICDTGLPDHYKLEAIKTAANFTPDPSVLDGNGHSTHVAGIICEIAPDSDILIAKVLSDEGSGNLSRIADGINWCVANGAHIINLSLGGRNTNAAFKRAIDNAVDGGVYVFAAAGNHGHSPNGANRIGYPAIYSNTITVGSSNRDGEVSEFSSGGPYGHIVVPGEKILSTYPPDAYRSLSGTSMATPFAAGIAALMIEAGGMEEKLAVHLRSVTDDWGSAGYNYDSFYGQVNPDKVFRKQVVDTIPEPPVNDPPTGDQPVTPEKFWIGFIGGLIISYLLWAGCDGII